MKRKPLRECVEILLDTETKDCQERKELEDLGLKDYTIAMVVAKKLVDKARNGDLKAYSIIEETIHEKPAETETLEDAFRF